MKTTLVVVVGGNSDLQKLAQDSAPLAFPAATVTAVESVDQVLNQDYQKAVDLLVFANPDPRDVTKAAEAIDAGSLRRWPVVVLGADVAVEGVESISPQEWDKHLAARVFRSVVMQHQLRRENVRLRGDLLTIGRRINHDLRTHLGCISTTGEALQEMLAEKALSNTPLTQRILDSADDLVKLIDRVSFLAKASADPPVKEKLDMGVVFWLATQRLERQMLKQSVSVIQPPAWPVVDGVAAWLEIVWWNLVANALQHEGSSRKIEVGWNCQKQSDRFWVQDNGNGVSSETQDLLFEPFHSLHEPGSGRGLGLSIVQRLVDLQGGECGYKPVPEGGSCFFFTLPRDESKPAGEHMERQPVGGDALAVSSAAKSR